jgi:tetratricopeptide (TPR) repeat protein
VATNPIERTKAIEGRVELSVRNGESDAALDLIDQGLQELGLRFKKSWFGLLWDINYGMLFASAFPEPVRRLITRNHRRSHYEAAYDLYHYASVAYHDLSFLRYAQASCLLFIASYKSGSDVALARAHAKFAFNLGIFGFRWLPMRMTNKSLTLSQAVGDPELEAFSVGFWGFQELFTGDLDTAMELLERSRASYKRVGENYYKFLTTHFCRHLYELKGDNQSELAAASDELTMSSFLNDPQAISWGYYGRANARARSGEFHEALMDVNKAVELLKDKSIAAYPVALAVQGFVLIQCSQYGEATVPLSDSVMRMEHDWMTHDFTVITYPLYIEALLGPQWHHADHWKNLDSKSRKTLRRTAIRAFMAGRLYKNCRFRALRARGRLARARGKNQKAIRLFNAAEKAADQRGARYDLARILLDRSVVDDKTREQDRSRAIGILKELKSVIPAAEARELGLEDLHQT